MFCFFSSRRRHTRCALVTGVQTCALPISAVATGLLPSQEHVMRWGCASSRFQAQSIEFRHALERRVACMMADRQRIIAAVEPPAPPFQIGRESCRERVCQYVSISVVAVSLKKKKHAN